MVPLCYNESTITIEDLFDLQTEELLLFLRKKKGCPKGNLRNIYHCQSNRALISKVVRETVKFIIYEVINGKTFYLPGACKSKIFVSVLNPAVTKARRQRGAYQNMDLFMTDFRVPQIQMSSIRRDNMCVYAGREFAALIAEKVNTTGRVGGKIPFRIQEILPKIYNIFSYISEKSIKLIIMTFFRRLGIVNRYGSDFQMRGKVHAIRFFTPKGIYHHKRTAEESKVKVIIKLKQDKIKNFPKCNKLPILSLS